ncbi:MAG: SH3 domain-containing protein [Capnocytophaga sp.]|nr:SH3 domain-containing protein [Capnocytophaga sp.]
MKNILTIFFAFITCYGFPQSQENETLFAKATENYNTGDFQAAVNNYMAILNAGFESSALYYNLANAHYKLNHVPESIYYYEKALILNPDNEDAKNNLVFANQMTIDAITPLPKTWFKNLSNSITQLFSLNIWSIFSISGVLGFVICFLLYYFSEKTIAKRIFFVGMLGALIIGVGTYFIADFHRKNIEGEKFAIFFDKTIRVFSEPNTYSSEIFSLHEGTKAEIIEQLNDWVKIKLADGKTGWVKESTLRIL